MHPQGGPSSSPEVAAPSSHILLDADDPPRRPRFHPGTCVEGPRLRSCPGSLSPPGISRPGAFPEGPCVSPAACALGQRGSGWATRAADTTLNSEAPGWLLPDASSFGSRPGALQFSARSLPEPVCLVPGVLGHGRMPLSVKKRDFRHTAAKVLRQDIDILQG